ncbi:hypothetical protein HYFRA_00007294 [Hymenoscyphus fraxineus]|uniref:Uncharacterized protein n=1 Tax=Hymenoscyphus fraxineus TaxID=746836 RepID=A0A9N9PRD8_9HELO|nr:hypothetical protein HYFRA_00007294 [Hymenoscyphus fraxineus]
MPNNHYTESEVMQDFSQDIKTGPSIPPQPLDNPHLWTPLLHQTHQLWFVLVPYD